MEKRCLVKRKERTVFRIVLLFTSILFLTACFPMRYWDVSQCVRGVTLGMTKQEVIQVMGKDYKVVRMEQRGRDRIEVWGFREPNGMYNLYFINDRFDYLEYQRDTHHHTYEKKNQESPKIE